MAITKTSEQLAKEFAPLGGSVKYPTRWAHFPFLRDKIAVEVREKIVKGRAFNVLDVGCGNGWFPHFCRNTLSGVQWTGTELWEYQIQQAAERNIYSRLIQTNLLNPLPFGQCTFDVIVCNEVLMYLPTPQNNLSEFYRVLLPGGLLSLYEPICWFPDINKRLWRLWRRLKPNKDVVTMDSLSSPWQQAKRPVRITCFSPESIRQSICREGFNVVWSGGFRIFRNRISPMKYLENLWPWYQGVTAVAQRWPYIATDLMVLARKR